MDDNQQENRHTAGAAPRKFTFYGSFDHSLDIKGRIIVPNAYRKPLGDVFTVSLTRDGLGIALYPDDVFDMMMEELYHLNQRNQNVQRYEAYIAKMSYRGMEADGQGRLLLPIKLRQMVLGDAKDVEISGALDHIRIVSQNSGLEEDAYFRQNRDLILNDIADMHDQ